MAGTSPAMTDESRMLDRSPHERSECGTVTPGCRCAHPGYAIAIRKMRKWARNARGVMPALVTASRVYPTCDDKPGHDEGSRCGTVTRHDCKVCVAPNRLRCLKTNPKTEVWACDARGLAGHDE